MGYITTFSLHLVSGKKSDFEKLLADIKDKFDLDFSQGNSVETTWYDHESDMQELSKKYPGLIVSLDGNGEDIGDDWCKRFYNGEVEFYGLEDPWPYFFQLASTDERRNNLQRIKENAKQEMFNAILSMVPPSGIKFEHEKPLYIENHNDDLIKGNVLEISVKINPAVAVEVELTLEDPTDKKIFKHLLTTQKANAVSLEVLCIAIINELSFRKKVAALNTLAIAANKSNKEHGKRDRYYFKGDVLYYMHDQDDNETRDVRVSQEDTEALAKKFNINLKTDEEIS